MWHACIYVAFLDWKCEITVCVSVGSASDEQVRSERMAKEWQGIGKDGEDDERRAQKVCRRSESRLHSIDQHVKRLRHSDCLN